MKDRHATAVTRLATHDDVTAVVRAPNTTQRAVPRMATIPSRGRPLDDPDISVVY